jgi:general secretion pathway protein D
MGMLLGFLLTLAAQEKPADRRGGTLEDVNLHDLTIHVQKVTGKTIHWTEELGLRAKRAHYVTDRPIGDDPVLLFKAYQHILQWNDLLLVASGKEGEEVYSLTALGTSLKKPLPVVRDGANPPERFTTRIFPLQNATPRALWPILSMLASSPQNVQPVDESGVLLVTDYDSNLRRLEEIIKILDVKKPDLEMKLIPLKHATAAKVEEKMNGLIQTLITRSPAARGVPAAGIPSVEPAKVVSDERTNSILLLAEPGRLAQMEDIARRLDAETPFETTGIHFAPLLHRNAIDVARTLTTLYRGGTIDEKATSVSVPTRTHGPNGPAPVAPPSPLVPSGPLSSGEPIIVPDVATNSLLIITDRATFRALEPIIRRLDRRRPQVFIKATVVEIAARQDFDLGIELARLESPKNKFVVGGRTAFGLSRADFDPASNVFTLTPVVSPGATLLGMKDRAGNIPALLHALEGRAKISILDEPETVTSDHQSADITATTEVPIAKTSYVGNVNGFPQASYEYVPAETTLSISPHISESGYLRLETKVVIQKFTPSTDPQVPPGRTSRTLTTKEVLVPSGGTVVLGGIVTSDLSSTVQSVPWLGSIPVIGALFRREQETQDRRTLYIFITATILYDEAFGDYRDLSQARKETMERLRGEPLEGLQVGPPSPRLPESTFRFLSLPSSVNR